MGVFTVQKKIYLEGSKHVQVKLERKYTLMVKPCFVYAENSGKQNVVDMFLILGTGTVVLKLHYLLHFLNMLCNK